MASLCAALFCTWPRRARANCSRSGSMRGQLGSRAMCILAGLVGRRHVCWRALSALFLFQSCLPLPVTGVML